MAIRRIYVERRPGFFNVPAQRLCDELKAVFDLVELRYVRIFRRYDIEGISDEDFSFVRDTVFADPAVDVLYQEELPDLKRDLVFAYAPLPGQYDKTADGAEQCIQMMTQKERPSIRTATVISISNTIDQKAFAQLKAYCINPADSRETTLDKVQTLQQPVDLPQAIPTITDFTILPEAMLRDLQQSMHLTMRYEDLVYCRDYFRDQEKRDPTETELLVLDAYWSERCRQTIFNTQLDAVTVAAGRYQKLIQETYEHYKVNRRINGEKGPECLLDIAQMGMRELQRQNRLPDLDGEAEANACSIVVPALVDGKEEDWLLMFKNKMQNQATEIEPLGGAATCLGGAIRDPLSGRAYVYQAMRITGSGDPRQKKVPEAGKLPQFKITRDAAAGASSYGNQVGVPTGHVKEFYHPGYAAQRLESSFTIGAVKKDNVRRAMPQPGDLVILVGGATGRDGIGGAKVQPQDERAVYECNAQVQKGNAIVERKLQRLFHNAEVTRLIKRCNDFAAGGIAVAVGELAEGVYINLDLLETKYDGLNGTELALSESQERLAVVVERADAALFLQYCNSENLSAAIVATIVEEKILHIVWKDEAIVALPRELLQANGAPRHALVNVTMPDVQKPYFSSGLCMGRVGATLSDLWLENLQDLNVCAQYGMSEQFDATVGAGNLLMPFGGYRQKTPAEGMAAKLPVEGGATSTATLAVCGFDPYLAEWSPFHGGFYAVVAALAKIVAMGGDYVRARLSLQGDFETLDDDPDKWGKPFAALLGAYLAQFSIGTAIIGGQESLSGTEQELHVPPALLAFAVCPVEVENVVSSEFKLAGNDVYVVPLPHNAFDMPDFNALQRNFAAVRQLVENKKLYSAMSIGKGGIAATLSKMCLGENLGFRFDDGISYDLEKLFTPLYGALIVEVSAGAKLDELKDTRAYLLGKVHKVPSIVYGNDVITIDEIDKAYSKTLEEVFPMRVTQAKSNMASRNLLNNDIGLKAEKVFALPSYDISLNSNRGYSKPFSVEYHSKNTLTGTLKLAQPRVFIPVFPGTNCEYDLEDAFTRAGAVVDTFVIKNLTAQSVEASLDFLAKKIRQAQIVALPGGFSGGDEPDGCGKFIAAAFRNPKVADAVHTMLYNRDGLMLGICNGFQALLKLGLLPYGRICATNVDAPTLSYNEIGRHVSRIVQTKVVSDLSPWFSQSGVGHLSMAPVSHGEGRFFASAQLLAQLRKNGQIATQYVDGEGNVSMDKSYNPNGSVDAIEGITSPDGRILGKIAHNERSLDGLSINVLRDQEQLLFASGVDYFR